MTKLHNIYTLRDENGTPFYIGKTNNPTKRLQRHLGHVRYGSHYPVHNKLRKVISIKGNTNDIFEVIEKNIPEEIVDDREMYFIKHYKEIGYKLKNLTDGGEGGKGYTDEINKRSAMKRKGLKRTDETCRRISNAKRGIKFTDAHKSALKKAWETREPLTPERYQKIGKLNRGVVNIKQYKILSPDGIQYITERGLTDFCREHGLDVRNLINTKPNGNRIHHKGWKIIEEL